MAEGWGLTTSTEAWDLFDHDDELVHHTLFLAFAAKQCFLQPADLTVRRVADLPIGALFTIRQTQRRLDGTVRRKSMVWMIRSIVLATCLTSEGYNVYRGPGRSPNPANHCSWGPSLVVKSNFLESLGGSVAAIGQPTGIGDKGSSGSISILNNTSEDNSVNADIISRAHSDHASLVSERDTVNIQLAVCRSFWVTSLPEVVTDVFSIDPDSVGIIPSGKMNQSNCTLQAMKGVIYAAMAKVTQVARDLPSGSFLRKARVPGMLGPSPVQIHSALVRSRGGMVALPASTM